MNSLIRKHQVAKEMIEFAQQQFFEAMTFYTQMKNIGKEKGKVS